MATRLQAIADGVWGVETSFPLGMTMALPLRMTVVRDSAGLTLVSPIEIDRELRQSIEALGKVHTLLAPNRLHHAFLDQAQRHFPAARLLGAPGLSLKRDDLRFDGVLSTGEVTDQLSSHLVQGADRLSEAVFFHDPSRTLILTDLAFNVHRANFASRLLLGGLSRAYGRLEQSRLFRSFTNDREAAGQSVRKILELPFERVVVAHGDVVETRAREQLTRGLWWMLGLPSRPAADLAQE